MPKRLPPVPKSFAYALWWCRPRPSGATPIPCNAYIFFFRFAVELFTLRWCCVNFYSFNLLFSLNNMSLSLPSDLPDDYTYVSVGKGSFEWRKYTWESAVCSKLCLPWPLVKCGCADVREGVFCGMRIAECGKLSTGNLRKIRCGFFLRNEG